MQLSEKSIKEFFGPSAIRAFGRIIAKTVIKNSTTKTLFAGVLKDSLTGLPPEESALYEGYFILVPERAKRGSPYEDKSIEQQILEGALNVPDKWKADLSLIVLPETEKPSIETVAKQITEVLKDNPEFRAAGVADDKICIYYRATHQELLKILDKSLDKPLSEAYNITWHKMGDINLL